MDALVSLLAGIAPTHWLALGLILLIAEMASGTTYLLWPAVAAGVTGLIAFTGLTTWPMDIAIFAVLVIALTYFGRPLVRKFRTESHLLNERAVQLIGTRGIAAQNFVNGVGSVKLNDTVWRAQSAEDIAAGASVEVRSVDGATLHVAAV